MNRRRSDFGTFSRKELRHAIKRAEPSIFEDILHFLEDDPMTFGSGYAKELMWQYIRRHALNESDIRRLERAALNYLERPMEREFRRMCQTMSIIATPFFWQEVEKRLESENPVTQLNAYCLFPYSKGVDVGEQQYHIFREIKHLIHLRKWEQKSRLYHEAKRLKLT